MDRIFKDIHIDGVDGDVTIRMERYESGRELIQTCSGREVTKGFPKDHFNKDYKCDERFEGISKMSQAFDMLNNGWTEKVEELKKTIKDVERRGYSDKNAGLKPDIVGFIPIVPNAIRGLPMSMLNTNVKPKKNKVISVVYGLSFNCGVDKSDIIRAGLKVMSAVMRLEAQGFRVKLTAMQNYSEKHTHHILAVNVKSEDQPLDAQRVMFPMFHPAMFRSIGFGWYERLPGGHHIYGYGEPINQLLSEQKIDDMICQLYGRTAIYIDGTKALREDGYIERRLQGVSL